MQYTSTLTRSGQITLPKPIRDLIGITYGERVRLSFKDDAIVLEREKTFDEIMTQIDTINTTVPKETKTLIRKYAGKTASELRDEFDSSPEGHIYYKEKYGIQS